jgi:PAS domain S-box-containing protein
MDPVLLALLIERLAWVAGGAVVLGGWMHRNPWVMPTARRALDWVAEHRPGAATHRKLDALLTQVYANGGSSMFDAVARLESGQGAIRDQLTLLEAHVAAVRDGSGVLSFLTDASGSWLQCSRPLLELMGMEQGEVIGNGWKNALDTACAEAFVQRWRSAVDEQRDYYGEIGLRNVRTREVVPVRMFVDVIHDPTGELRGWVGRVGRLA